MGNWDRLRNRDGGGRHGRPIVDDAYGVAPTFGRLGRPKVNAHPAPRPQHRQGEHQANEDPPHLLILAP